jgi:hypothetical protein
MQKLGPILGCLEYDGRFMRVSVECNPMKTESCAGAELSTSANENSEGSALIANSDFKVVVVGGRATLYIHIVVGSISNQ